MKGPFLYCHFRLPEGINVVPMIRSDEVNRYNDSYEKAVPLNSTALGWIQKFGIIMHYHALSIQRLGGTKELWASIWSLGVSLVSYVAPRDHHCNRLSKDLAPRWLSQERNIKICGKLLRWPKMCNIWIQLVYNGKDHMVYTWLQE